MTSLLHYMVVRCSGCNVSGIMPGRPGDGPIRCSHCGSIVDVEFIRDFRPWLLTYGSLLVAVIVFLNLSRLVGVLCVIAGISTAIVLGRRIKRAQRKPSVSSISEIATLIRRGKCTGCGSAVRATGVSRMSLPSDPEAILFKRGLSSNQLVQRVEVKCVRCGRTTIVEVDVSQMPEIVYGANLISGVDQYLATFNKWDKDMPQQ
jgi:hypothetical protein